MGNPLVFFDHGLTVLTGIMVRIREIIPTYGFFIPLRK